MRIGIYSLPLHANYGGILQSYALHVILRRMGHEVFVLNRNWVDKLGKKGVAEKMICSLINLFRSEKLHTRHEKYLENISELKRFWYSKIVNFIDFHNFSEVKALRLDSIIVGSDQVWRLGYCRDSRCYFLDFAKDWNVNRIAYAASFGVREWQFDEKTTNEMRALAALFIGISVREIDAIKLCKEYLGVDAFRVLDPTLLLHSQDYNKFRVNRVIGDRKRFVSFMLHPNDDKLRLSSEVAKSVGADLIDISVPDEYSSHRVVNKYISIERWLTEFLDADYVLTDSYHGMIFSLNFNKPFVTLGNAIGGQSRFTSFLEDFHLEDRISTNKETIVRLYKENIDWAEVNRKRKQLEVFSIDFIEKSLGR